MKLDKDSLPNYFTIASPANSHFKEKTNTFDFVNRESDTLVVTVGDSWTWGSDLLDTDRLTQVYGNIISDKLTADWLNLGQPGSSNFFIAERVEELGKLIPNLHYRNIYLICTFTEIGRGINSHHDMHIDYYNWFRHNEFATADDFYRLLDFLNRDCLNRVRAVADCYNLKLVVGSNFVDPIGIDNDPGFLSVPWFRVLNIPCPVTGYAASAGIDRVKDLIEFVPADIQHLFKSWIVRLIDQAAYIDQVCRSKVLKKIHPTANGHASWANYILENIK